MIENGYKNEYYYSIYYWLDDYYPEYGTYVSTAAPFYGTFGMIRGTFNKDIIIYTVTESISTVTGENVKTESTGMSLKARVRPLTQFEIMRNKPV